MTRKVLICDDDVDRRKDWREDLRRLLGAGWDVRTIDGPEAFAAIVDNLVARQLQMTPGQDDPAPSLIPSLAGADVLVVDYDLRFFRRGISGEDFCYLARCFSDVKTILGVNRDRLPAPFYLTLQDPIISFADVNVGESQISNPWLWGQDRPDDQAAPWYWPDLTRLTDSFDERVGDASDHLDTPVLDFLGLTDAPVPAVLLAALDTSNAGVSTLRTLAHDSALGLRGKDVQIADADITTRVIAARLAKWLRWLPVVQDVLIDAPHLVELFPGLLGPKNPDLPSWQSLCRREASAAELLPLVTGYEFTRPAWADRPLWRMDQLYNSPLPAIAEPWNAPDAPADVVFAEDVSQFVPRDTARSFFVQAPGGSPNRWVIADGESQAAYPGVEDLDYYPSDYFAR